MSAGMKASDLLGGYTEIFSRRTGENNPCNAFIPALGTSTTTTPREAQ
jgi:hypothetical protein